MNDTLRAPAHWQAVVYGLIALTACAATFVGLSASGFWIDELFTVHLVNHHGGFVEVFHRVVRDTHPPLYSLILYAWTRVAGISETSLRLPSAIFAVSAIAVFALGTHRVLSRATIAFACAVASVSSLWFEQAQNARSYAVSFFLAASLLSLTLAFRRRVRTNPTFPLAHWMWLSLLGLVASLTHAYLLLTLGMVLLFLLITLPSWRVRGALVVTGLVVLAVNVLYYKIMLHSTEYALQDVWLGNDASFFKQHIRIAFYDLMARNVIAVIVLLVLFGIWQKVSGQPSFVYDDQDTRWATRLAAFVPIGVIVCGISVSLLVAPSFSDRNVSTCVPFAWFLVGRLYDATGPRGYTRTSAAIAALAMLLVGSYLLRLPGRMLSRTENWRSSAQFVSQLPGCSGQLLPAILPYHFGQVSPYFLALSEREFFGYYMPQGTQIHGYLPAQFAARRPAENLPALLASRAANADKGGCTLLAWGVHDIDESSALEIALDLARQPGVAPRRVLMQEFIAFQPRSTRWEGVAEGYVYLAIPQASTSPSVEPPTIPDIHLSPENASTLGDRVVVDYLTTYSHAAPPAYDVDVYDIQRWSPKQSVREDFLAVHRLTCDVAVTKSNWDAWPDPRSPGCSDRPPPTSAGKVNGQL